MPSIEARDLERQLGEPGAYERRLVEMGFAQGVDRERGDRRDMKQILQEEAARFGGNPHVAWFVQRVLRRLV